MCIHVRYKLVHLNCTYLYPHFHRIQDVLRAHLKNTKGHESIKWDGRKRVESGTMAELTEYMYQNGGGCQWGKFPSLWKAHFPERPLDL